MARASAPMPMNIGVSISPMEPLAACASSSRVAVASNESDPITSADCWKVFELLSAVDGGSGEDAPCGPVAANGSEREKAADSGPAGVGSSEVAGSGALPSITDGNIGAVSGRADAAGSPVAAASPVPRSGCVAKALDLRKRALAAIELAAITALSKSVADTFASAVAIPSRDSQKGMESRRGVGRTAADWAMEADVHTAVNGATADFERTALRMSGFDPGRKGDGGSCRDGFSTAERAIARVAAVFGEKRNLAVAGWPPDARRAAERAKEWEPDASGLRVIVGVGERDRVGVGVWECVGVGERDRVGVGVCDRLAVGSGERDRVGTGDRDRVGKGVLAGVIGGVRAGVGGGWHE